MFEIGKKGSTDKGQESKGQASMARDDHHPSAASPAIDPPGQRRPSGPHEAAVIGPSITIDGDLRGDEDLVIEGEVSGTVQLKNNSLTIGSKGKVRADVYAHSVHVEGSMEGDVYGAERVSIRKSAQIRGNITSPRVSLEDGARFKGSIEMDPQAVEAALGTKRSAAPDTAKTGGTFKQSADAPAQGKAEAAGKR
jgi:cytoskeletal protein CcmA (bactofilin family)